MENRIEINEVDLGDDTLTADPTLGSGVLLTLNTRQMNLLLLSLGLS
jgi:hypothetical protein